MSRILLVLVAVAAATLAACGGDDLQPSPAPLATPTPPTTSTPTPIGDDTLQGATCESGVAVPDPTTNTELVEDCASLLKAKDRLAGTATLNWSAGRPMSQWEGITIAGTPQRVTKLELASSGLTGELTGLLGNLTGLTHLRLNGNALTGRIPSKLQQLTALTHLYLAANSLTGCVPPSLRDVSNHDLASLGVTDCGPPRAIEFDAELIEGGQTITFQPFGNYPSMVVDLPEGHAYTIEGRMGDSVRPGIPSLVVQVVITDAQGYKYWVTFHPKTGKELWRFIDLQGFITPADREARSVGSSGSHPLYDVLGEIAESAWIQE